MRTIWKFPVDTPSVVMLPKDAEAVHVGKDPNGVPCLWALVDPAAEMERVWLDFYGTGHTITNSEAVYIGTWMDGPFVWHLFASPALPVSDPP